MNVHWQKKLYLIPVLFMAAMLIAQRPAAAADTSGGDSLPSLQEGADTDTGTVPSDAAPAADPDSGAEEKELPVTKRPGKDAKVVEGYYYLQPACSKKRVAGIAGKSKKENAKVRLGLLKNADYQTFYIKPVGKSLYTIQNKNSGLYLESEGAGTKKKTNVCQSAYTGANSQKWYITKKKSGTYRIQSAISANVLAVEGSKDRNKQKVYLYTYRGKKGQRWTLTRFKKSGKWGSTNRIWKGSREDYRILANIIGAIESGEQIYGNLNYGSYDPPYKNSPNEHTITIGWPQCYGPEAGELLRSIFKRDKKTFRKIDSVLPENQRIEKVLNRNITAMRWRPASKQKKVIIKLLKTEAGRDAQDAQFTSYMKSFVNDCCRTYTKNAWAVVMYCQIRHLGGKNGADRIFRKCAGDYSLKRIMSVLKLDQYDGRSSYQVGDKIFWSRHECVCTFLQTFMQ